MWARRGADLYLRIPSKQSMWHRNILETIGNTPLVQLNKVTQGLKPTILAKLEYLNPGGSVKDRIGLQMLEAAEASGQMLPGGTLIEGTSGNTGMGLALAAAVKGYRCIFTMPDKMSKEKIDALRALGAEVIVTPTDVEHDDPRSYHSVARRLNGEIPGSFFPNQYENLSNSEAHYLTTGPEIWEQTDGRVTHVVIGVGTGGTITGTARFLKEKSPDVRIIGVDPEGSIFAEMFRSGQRPEPQPYKVEGIGQTEKPGNLDFSVIDQMYSVSDKDSFLMTRKLARQEGVFAGGSSGSVVHVALKCAEEMDEDAVIVIIIPDSGARYLSKIYDDNWMRENQYLETMADIRASEVVGSKTRRSETMLLIPLATSIQDAVGLMREHAISQLPIIETEGVVGSISEARILDILVADSSASAKPVAEYMEPPFPILQSDASISLVADHMKRDITAVLVQSGEDFDIITKSDLIEFLTRQQGEGTLP
jgi:cystathionine beta-synthase